MKGVETYLHRHAKGVLATWLRGRSKVGVNFKAFPGIRADIPLSTDKPMYGVYEEYPVVITQDDEPEPIGHRRLCEGGECDHKHAWECYNSMMFKVSSKMHGIPSARDIKRFNEKTFPQTNRLKMRWFFDVGIVDNEGRLCTVFEVCHSNPMTEAKIEWLNENNVKWYEISAEWIMGRVRSPFSLKDGIIRQTQ